MSIQEALESGGVYQIKVGDTLYIGETKLFASRISAHITQLKCGKHPCKPLQEAFYLYNSYSIEIVEIVPDDAFSSPERRAAEYFQHTQMRDSGFKIVSSSRIKDSFSKI